MRKIAISGGKGGVGKSVIAANLGITLASKGRSTVLFDADLQLANVDVLLGITSEHNLQHVVNGEMSLVEILTEGPNGLKVITGGSAVQGLMNAGPKRMSTFISQFDELESTTDFLIFDTGAGLDNRIMTFLRLADQVVLVTSPDPTSVTDAYATCKVLVKKDPQAQIGIVVNEVVEPAEAQRVFGALNEICVGFLGRSVHFMGSVRTDPDVVKSVRKCKPLLCHYPDSKAAFDIEQLALALEGSTALRIAA